MRRGIAAFATLIVAIGAMASPSSADGLMVVTVRESGGNPARGAVVAIKQTIGDAGKAAVVAEHCIRLRQLAQNVHAGLDADRANARGIPGLVACSNETRAGVEMLARCPPGWEANAAVALRSDRRECRQRLPGYEPDRD